MNNMKSMLEMTARFSRQYVNQLGQSELVCDTLFRQFTNEVQNEIDTAWDIANQSELERAAKEKLETIRIKSISEAFPNGRKSNYTAEEYARATLAIAISEKYISENEQVLDAANRFHEQIIETAIKKNLKEKLIEAGKSGHLFIAELTPRIAPLLYFKGASRIIEGSDVRYGYQMRKDLGEKDVKSKVSDEAVKETIENIFENLTGVKYILAETSSAPMDRVPSARLPPRVHIIGAQKEENNISYKTMGDYKLSTPFRQHFDAMVRETMYLNLIKMFGGENK